MSRGGGVEEASGAAAGGGVLHQLWSAAAAASHRLTAAKLLVVKACPEAVAVPVAVIVLLHRDRATLLGLRVIMRLLPGAQCMPHLYMPHSACHTVDATLHMPLQEHKRHKKHRKHKKRDGSD